MMARKEPSSFLRIILRAQIDPTWYKSLSSGSSTFGSIWVVTNNKSENLLRAASMALILFGRATSKLISLFGKHTKPRVHRIGRFITLDDGLILFLPCYIPPFIFL